MNFIPQVEFMKLGGKNLDIKKISTISYNSKDAEDVAELLQSYLTGLNEFSIINETKLSRDAIVIKLVESGDNTVNEAGLIDEVYSININDNGVELRAKNRQGLCRAVQTLRQILPATLFNSEIKYIGNSCLISHLEIQDSPKFPWRGAHLDVARHFFSIAEVCRFIELIAQHKFNTFHWHLSDDQGWRIEIKAFPKLTEVASKRTSSLIGHQNAYPHKFDGITHEGFYTQNEIKEVVEFARKRGINVVPEIDMPGHMQAAITAYPEWGNNPDFIPGVRTYWGVSQNILNPKSSTIKAMTTILGEILELFPSQYIHIGGDEAPKYEWNNSDVVQEMMIEKKLKDANELQSYFIGKVNSFLQSQRRTLIGWDEILEGGLCDNAVVTCWRSDEHALFAARHEHYVINTRTSYTYFDFYQADPEVEPFGIGGDLSCEKVYRFPVIPEGLEPEFHKYILGGQCQLWSEYLKTFSHVEYMTYPRACALSEVLWYKGAKLRFRNFVDRLNVHRQRLNNQSVSAHDLP